MTVLGGIVDRRFSFTLRELALPAAVLALLLWFVIVAVQGARLALRAWTFPPGEQAVQDIASTQMLWAAGGVYLVCFLATLIARRLAPAWTLPIAFVAGGIVIAIGAVGTGSVAAFIPAVTLIVISWLLGDALLRYLLPAVDAPVVRVPIAVSLGLGILGLLLLLLATFSALNAVSVLVSAVVILAISVAINRDRLREDIARLRAWRPQAPSWFESVVIGLSAGLVALAMLAAFVPETLHNASDVVRQHLPVIREIWQTGSAAEFPPMGASEQPILGHLLYAAAYGFGGSSAARLVQISIALVTIAGVAGIGWLGGGRVAATVGAAVFATIPIAMWVSGHVHSDLIATLFAVAATLCILLWQRDGMATWLLTAGALGGFGFAAKLNLGIVIVALAAGLFLVGRGPWQWRERIFAVVAYGLGGLAVIIPWIMRSYSLTGALPGVEKVLEQAQAVLPNQTSPDASPGGEESVVAARRLGLGRSPIALLRGAWDLTFEGGSSRYRVILNGEFGIALLMLLPLAILGPRTRAAALLAVATAVSFVGWVFTIQVSRHLLPTLALAAALVGIGVSNAVSTTPSLTRRTLATAARMAIVAGIVAAPFYFLPNKTTRLPVDLLLGRETSGDYLAREIRSLPALAAATATFPPDTRVGYVGLWEGPQLYTEARLWYLGSYADDDRNFLNNQLGATSEDVLASLAERGLRYFIWDRTATRPEDWQSTLLSGRFLRDYTRILAGNQDAYLFEVLPNAGKIWGMENPRNLLLNPEFTKLRRDNSGWKIGGRVSVNDGIVSLRPESSLAQRVTVLGGNAYLFAISGFCEYPNDRAELTLRWLDERGTPITFASDTGRLGTAPNDLFLWHIAPDDAVAVSVEAAMVGASRCEFDGIALYEAT